MRARKFCMLALALAFAALTATGDNSKIDDRIVGGYKTNINQNKWLVQLRYSGSWICGGTLVSRTHVVTAAHCVENTPARVLSIKAGSTYLYRNGKVRQVVKVWVHPKYNSRTVANDIAVLKLDRPVSGSSIGIAPLCTSTMKGGDKVIVAGWGDTTEGGWPSDHLRAVKLPVLGRQSCRRAYPGELTASMFCAGKAGKDSCQGDSGGPMMKNGKLCGVVSWGYGCANAGSPGVYTSVNYMKNFIKSKMKL